MDRKHYGQSIIIDTEDYKNIHLGEIVNNVLAKLNEKIKPGKYKFKLFSMDTMNERTNYLDQRKSLTSSVQEALEKDLGMLMNGLGSERIAVLFNIKYQPLPKAVSGRIRNVTPYVGFSLATSIT